MEDDDDVNMSVDERMKRMQIQGDRMEMEYQRKVAALTASMRNTYMTTSNQDATQSR